MRILIIGGGVAGLTLEPKDSVQGTEGFKIQNRFSGGMSFCRPSAMGSNFHRPKRYQAADETHGLLSAPFQSGKSPKWVPGFVV